MRQVLATAHTLVGDLADRENVERLLRRFYGGHFVMTCSPSRSPACFRAGRYRGNALHAHQRVHSRTP